MTIHRADAVWEAGRNEVRTESGAPLQAPAELMSGAVVASFNETLGRMLEHQGFRAVIRSSGMCTSEEGFICKVELTVRANAPQLNQVALRRMADQAKLEAPVARALKTRVDILAVISADVPSTPPVELAPYKLRVMGQHPVD